ncbi:hypothetical protein OOZ15_16770 [Galbibacter sp. EGI 63066]|uniref:TOTE conflict system archaeo-eukaryotic primase domain-containing protein n=1 Tax=Galbibacter sp. EGI 63066 TaxID=2993559 RepID=UPI002248B9B7|nr:hypothetical protein [Galbibacter sp. EGI 63066]MCX2681609.1 hypothetical protein [Galbibacter sp. EGI 63066]
MPAYSYDPYMYRLHKQRGGTFKDYKDKTYLRFDDFQLSRHLEGRQAAGIYPLLQDNTSWFIAADFDKKDWQEQSQKAIKLCEKFNIPAYLERSRSGNGAHVVRQLGHFYLLISPKFADKKVSIKKPAEKPASNNCSLEGNQSCKWLSLVFTNPS